jgi:hypothetical protein
VHQVGHLPELPNLDSFVANEKKWNLDPYHVAVNNISTDVLNFTSNFEMSGFRRHVVDVFDFLGYCAAWVGSWLPTFRENASFPLSRVKQFNCWDRSNCLTLGDWKAETSVINCQPTLRNNSERRIPERLLSVRCNFSEHIT